MSSASKQRSYRGASTKDIISGSGYIADRPHGATTSGGAGSASKQRSYRGASAEDIISGSGYIADRPHGATTSGGAGPEILGQILQLVAKIAGVICKGA
jgi:hypothetical protein